MVLSSLFEIAESIFLKVMLNVLSGERRIRFLRWHGLKIGAGCEIHATEFSTEPFLIEIGDHVSIAPGTMFITHDGSVRIIRDTNPEADLFGKIIVGSHTFIGSRCILLPNTTIGEGCIIGAGSVVRGVIPDHSVAYGNPARVVMKTNILKTTIKYHKHTLNTKSLGKKEKIKVVRDHFGV